MLFPIDIGNKGKPFAHHQPDLFIAACGCTSKLLYERRTASVVGVNSTINTTTITTELYFPQAVKTIFFAGNVLISAFV